MGDHGGGGNQGLGNGRQKGPGTGARVSEIIPGHAGKPTLESRDSTASVLKSQIRGQRQKKGETGVAANRERMTLRSKGYDAKEGK